MSERMNKERAKQEIIATRRTYADKKQKLEEKNEFEKSELKRRENKSFIHLYDNKIKALDIAIDSLDNTMTNREYMHLVGVTALFDTNFDLDKPLEKDFVKFLYALNQVEKG